MLEKIKELCAKKQVSISELERACSIGNGTIARWGESSPSVSNLKKVADYFGCTVDELISD